MRERVKLVLYLTASYPSVQKFKEIIEKTRSIVDMFEIGVPTVNPKYDGPTIRMTYREAEIKGLEAIKTLPAITSDFTVMSYLEDHLHHFEDFVNLVKSLSAKSILLPDLLFDYYDYIDLYVKLCRKYGVEPSFFISSKFPYRVVRKLLTYSPLFIYLGLQASSGIKLPLLVERNVRIIKELIGNDCELHVGFAIRSIDEVRNLKKLNVNAVVIGSAFVKLLKSNGFDYALSFLKELRSVLER